MSNPIKALEAGAAALCEAQGIGPTPNELARAGVEAAAAIAAFLRALAPPGDESNTIWCLVLAAAVEAAARGDV